MLLDTLISTAMNVLAPIARPHGCCDDADARMFLPMLRVLRVVVVVVAAATTLVTNANAITL